MLSRYITGTRGDKVVPPSVLDSISIYDSQGVLLKCHTVRYRAAILMLFYEFIGAFPILRTSVTLPRNRFDKCIGILNEHANASIDRKCNWNAIIPRFTKTSSLEKIRRVFQYTKKYTRMSQDINCVCETVGKLMYSFTIEDILEFLYRTVVDSRFFIATVINSQGRCKSTTNELVAKFGEEKFIRLASTLYQLSNRYLNWIVFNNKQIINFGIIVTGWDGSATSSTHAQAKRLRVSTQDRIAENTDLRCSRCYKLATVRLTRRKGNPKMIEPIYSTDVHSFLSACCGAVLVRVPLVYEDGTALTIFTGAKQWYGPCACCSKIINVDNGTVVP